MLETMDVSKAIKLLESLTGKKVVLEDITLPINVGDTILRGKFRNKKVEVKEIGEDEHGSPTVNGKSILNIRIPKREE